MTRCPACRGTGRVLSRPLLVGARFQVAPACRACRGSGRLVDVLLR